MVSDLTWVLAAVAAYTLVAMWLRNRGQLPEYVRLWGPITTLHTERGRSLLNRLARHTRFWRAWGNFGVGLAVAVMGGAFLGVVFAGFQAVRRPAAQPVRNPQNVLVIPGVNDFLPLSAAPEIVFGLALGLVVHEGGHGLLCRVEDIDIDSMGLASLAFVPIGAFVQPDEESRAKADRGAQTRMFAAGVTNNFAIAAVAFLLLFGPLAGSITTVSGVPVGDVAEGSSAAKAGLERGDVIVAVEGRRVHNASELDRAVAASDDPAVTVRLRNGDRLHVERQLILTRAVSNVLSDLDVEPGDPPRVQAVNGTPVATEAAFGRAMADHTVARVRTDAGTTTVPVGTYVSGVSADGPFGEAGAPTDGTPIIVTRIAGERTPNASALASVLDRQSPGDTVTVAARVDGERERYNVTLGEQDGDAYLGVIVVAGSSGLVVDDLGVQPYPAEQFLRIIGGTQGLFGGLTGGTVFEQIRFNLVLPFWSLIGLGTFDFAGFTGGVQNFYRATGPLSVFGTGTILLAANLAFWTAWINFQIALFNCIPTYPLDGGHILRTSTESVVSRLPIPGRRTVTTALTLSVTAVMIAAIALMLFGPMLLS